jgi:hypothetical protein
MRRIPDIFLTSQQLIERAREARRKADKLAGSKRERALAEARQDETMAELKRFVGDAENAAPSR